jgi:hypothetical protein
MKRSARTGEKSGLESQTSCLRSLTAGATRIPST